MNPFYTIKPLDRQNNYAMGRYTSVQSFSDENTKVVSGYGGEDAGDKKEKAKSTDDDQESKKRRLETEKIFVASGSCAGASSAEFDIYRAARRRELTRLEEIEKEVEEAQRIKEFEIKIAMNKKMADEKTSKNAMKRHKKKEKLKELKHLSKRDAPLNVDVVEDAKSDDENGNRI